MCRIHRVQRVCIFILQLKFRLNVFFRKYSGCYCRWCPCTRQTESLCWHLYTTNWSWIKSKLHLEECYWWTRLVSSLLRLLYHCWKWAVVINFLLFKILWVYCMCVCACKTCTMQIFASRNVAQCGYLVNCGYPHFTKLLKAVFSACEVEKNRNCRFLVTFWTPNYANFNLVL